MTAYHSPPHHPTVCARRSPSPPSSPCSCSPCSPPASSPPATTPGPGPSSSSTRTAPNTTSPAAPAQHPRRDSSRAPTTLPAAGRLAVRPGALHPPTHRAPPYPQAAPAHQPWPPSSGDAGAARGNGRARPGRPRLPAQLPAPMLRCARPCPGPPRCPSPWRTSLRPPPLAELTPPLPPGSSVAPTAVARSGLGRTSSRPCPAAGTPPARRGTGHGRTQTDIGPRGSARRSGPLAQASGGGHRRRSPRGPGAVPVRSSTCSRRRLSQWPPAAAPWPGGLRAGPPDISGVLCCGGRGPGRSGKVGGTAGSTFGLLPGWRAAGHLHRAPGRRPGRGRARGPAPGVGAGPLPWSAGSVGPRAPRRCAWSGLPGTPRRASLRPSPAAAPAPCYAAPAGSISRASFASCWAAV